MKESVQRAVILLQQRTTGGSRYLAARVTESGDLRIEGQDLGAEVEAFWGEGLREYEWAITIGVGDLDKFMNALRGGRADKLLALLAVRFQEDPVHASKSFLETHGVPFEFWSRVGE